MKYPLALQFMTMPMAVCILAVVAAVGLVIWLGSPRD